MVSVRGFLLLLLGAVPVLALAAQDKSDGSDPLKPFGCKLASDVVVLSEEAEVDKSLRALKTSYNTVLAARKTLAKVEQLAQQNRDAIKQMMQERSRLGALLSSP